MGAETKRPRAVLIGAKLYPEAAWEASLNEAALEELSDRIPEGSSPREAMRAIRGMKDPAVFDKVLKAALTRVEKAAEPFDVTADPLVVARFPRP